MIEGPVFTDRPFVFVSRPFCTSGAATSYAAANARIVQVAARLRRREPRCRKRLSASCGSRNEANGRANRSCCTGLRDRGRFRLRVVASLRDGAASARAAAGRAAAHEGGGACRRLALASEPNLLARPRPGGAPGQTTQCLRAASQASDGDANSAPLLAAGQPGWSFGGSAAIA